MITDDVTVIQQITQQENSPALKNDSASQPALKKLDRQKQEMEAAVKSSLRIFDELTGPVLKSLKSSVLALAYAAKAPTKAVILGAAHRVSRSATTKVKIHVSRATLTRLLRSRHSVTVNLRIVTVIPSSLLKSGIPLSTIRQVKLSKTAPRHRHKP